MEGGSDDRLKRRHDSISPQTPVEIRKKMRRHARTVHEEEGVDDVDDVMPARLASKRKVEKHPSKAAAVLAKVAKKGIDSDDDGEVPSIPGTANPRGDTLYQTPPKLKATRSVFEEATLDRHHASSGGDANLVLPPPARVLTEEEMERRRRRRNSKTFQSRRKSLTPNAKTKQYVSEMYSTIIKMSSENLTVANTIETNLKHINMKSVDLEFQVDPLFQKMSQAFDEGGAKGMLLVNLSVHNGCKIVLDSSNVKAASNTPADGHAAAADDGADDKLPRKMINISGLTKRLRASATVVEVCICGSFDICPKLDHFYDQLKTMNNEYFDKKISVPRLDLAASSHNRRLTLLSQGLITPRKTPLKPPANAEEDANPLENTSTLDIDQPDFGMGGNDGDDEMGQDDNDGAGFETYADDATQQPSGRSQHDDNDKDAIEKTEPEEPVVVAKPLNFDDDNETSYLLESALMRSVNAEQMDEYSFFDAKTLKNWAGPQHWKVKLPGIRVKKSAVVGRAADKQGGDDDDGGGGPKKPKTSRTTTPGKLQWSLTPTQVTQALKKPRQAASLEISPSILKRNESKAAQLVHPVDMHMKVERFYQLFTRPRSNVMFASMMAAAPRKALHHSFSRVDVKKLKESIWGTLPFQDAAMDDLTRATTDLAIQSKVSFEELVQDVAPKVPPNVTVSFYFICMLHLANDKGLELVGQDDMRDFQILHDPSVPR
ncbi:hypothetical protein B5M09_009795 [Aphanomyces astaci]|uniref:Condensin complex subunit 2 n=1 Tax=Aphanomyces astaci TaxID=112090 RepID=A0A425CWL2_APHAT|nr:hypothetical protein B5M09_009795 [Aphanomyces astaci]